MYKITLNRFFFLGLDVDEGASAGTSFRRFGRFGCGLWVLLSKLNSPGVSDVIIECTFKRIDPFGMVHLETLKKKRKKKLFRLIFTFEEIFAIPLCDKR